MLLIECLWNSIPDLSGLTVLYSPVSLLWIGIGTWTGSTLKGRNPVLTDWVCLAALSVHAVFMVFLFDCVIAQSRAKGPCRALCFLTAL